MIQPRSSTNDITNFILIKYAKKHLDVPGHVGHVPSLAEWNDQQEVFFRVMLEQLNYFYPKATVHVLTNERQRDTGRLVWHYHPEAESNHTAKFLLYGLLDQPALYLDTDILLFQRFRRKHLTTDGPFNLFQISSTRNLQSLCGTRLEVDSDRQYNCGMIWIAAPNGQIVTELQKIKRKYFNERGVIEGAHAWFNNDEHAVSYLVAKYGMRMRLFPEVNAFRGRVKADEIFNMQSVHYTGVKNKALFAREYKDHCKMRVRIF